MIAWIVVANSAEARIYSTSADTLTPLKLVMSMSHRQSRLKGAALLSDRPGRVRKTATAPSAFAMEPHTTPKQVEYERFANEVAAALLTGFDRQRFESLALAAPAHFLGLLTARLDPQVGKCVVARLHKDLVYMKPRELSPHLQPVRVALQAERRRRAAWK